MFDARHSFAHFAMSGVFVCLSLNKIPLSSKGQGVLWFAKANSQRFSQRVLCHDADNLGRLNEFHAPQAVSSHNSQTLAAVFIDAVANREASVGVGGSEGCLVSINSRLVVAVDDADALPRNYEALDARWKRRCDHDVAEAIEAGHHAISHGFGATIDAAITKRLKEGAKGWSINCHNAIVGVRACGSSSTKKTCECRLLGLGVC